MIVLFLELHTVLGAFNILMLLPIILFLFINVHHFFCLFAVVGGMLCKSDKPSTTKPVGKCLSTLFLNFRYWVVRRDFGIQVSDT